MLKEYVEIPFPETVVQLNDIIKKYSSWHSDVELCRSLYLCTRGDNILPIQSHYMFRISGTREFYMAAKKASCGCGISSGKH